MQVSRFSPRISLIEMTHRPAPRSSCPGRPALPLPCLSPQTDTTMFALIYKIIISSASSSIQSPSCLPARWSADRSSSAAAAATSLESLRRHPSCYLAELQGSSTMSSSSWSTPTAKKKERKKVGARSQTQDKKGEQST